jgi:hypothetical protein
MPTDNCIDGALQRGDVERSRDAQGVADVVCGASARRTIPDSLLLQGERDLRHFRSTGSARLRTRSHIGALAE